MGSNEAYDVCPVCGNTHFPGACLRETKKVEVGWQCPVCKNVYSPLVLSCSSCNRSRLPKQMSLFSEEEYF